MPCDDVNKICNECSSTGDVEVEKTIDDDKCISDVTFGELKQWMTSVFNQTIGSIVEEKLKDIVRKVDDLKKDNKTLSSRLTETEKRFQIIT